MSSAKFDINDHATVEGYATWGLRDRMSILCRLVGHRWPEPPANPNGHSPSNYAHCQRKGCKTRGHWYVLGQHRFGSYDKAVFDAYGLGQEGGKRD